MALSVSGFPEPPRHTEVYIGEDGYSKSTLMSSPRLRGLFGTSSSNNNGGNKKSQPTATTTVTTTSKPDETEFPSTTTPPTTPMLSFSGSSFEPLSQQEYELEFQVSPSKRPRLPSLPRRTEPSPVRLGPNLTRFDIAAWSRSPTTLLHSSSPSSSHPKPSPPPQLPSVVVEEWGGLMKTGDTTATGTATGQPPRPLPSVPGLLIKDPSAKPSAVPDPTTAPVKPPPPPKHVNAVAGPSKHVVANAVAGPSKHPHPLLSPTSKVLLTQTPTHKTRTPSFSMRYQPLVAGTSTEATSKDVGSSVRPLPRIPPPAPLLDTTPGSAKPKRPKTSPSAIITGFPTSGSAGSTPHPSPFVTETNSCTLGPWASKPVDLHHRRRPSSPPLPISSALKTPRSRSVSRPQPVVPPQQQHQRQRRDRSLDSYYAKNRSGSGSVPISIPLVAAAAAAGTSSVATSARVPRSLPSPTILGARPLPKKAVTLDTDQLNSSSATKGLKIQTTPALSRSNTYTHTRVTSPAGKRTLPALHPTGPVKPRTKPSPVTSPIVSPIATPVVTARSLPLLQLSPPPTRPASPEKKKPPAPAPLELKLEPEHKTAIKLEYKAPDETISIESPLHSHPIDAFLDNDSLLHPQLSPTNPTFANTNINTNLTTSTGPISNNPESLIEVFIDDQHRSASSRSPSPIRYARPDSHGNLADSDDDDFDDFDNVDGDDMDDDLEELEFGWGSGTEADGMMSEEEDERSVDSHDGGDGVRKKRLRRRRRTEQLRSYRNSYRPRGADGSPPQIPYRSASPAPAIPSPSQKPDNKEKDKDKDKDKDKTPKTKPKAEKKKHKQKEQKGPPGSATGSCSTPGTRASSPERERKSRSRQPRKLAEAVSAALEEVVRGRGGGRTVSGVRRVGSGSPRGRGKPGSGPPPPAPLMPTPFDATVLDIRDVQDYNYTEVLDICLPPPPPPPPEPPSSTSSSLKRRDTGRTISTSTGSSSVSSVSVLASASTSGSASARSSAMRVGGFGGGEAPFMWVSASKPAVMPMPVTMPFGFGRTRLASSSSSSSKKEKEREREREREKEKEKEREKEKEKEREKEKEKEREKEKEQKRRTMSVVSDDIYVKDDEYDDLTTSPGVVGWLNNHERVANPNLSDDENIVSTAYEPVFEHRFEPAAGPGDVLVTTTTRIIRGVDDDGADRYSWELERETGVVDVIPHLRNLKWGGK